VSLLLPGLPSVLVFVLGALSGGGAGRPAPTTHDDEVGHRRMLAELARVAQRVEFENDYLGRVPLEKERARLDGLGPGTPVLAGVQQRVTVGLLEMRAGNPDRAVDVLTEALASLDADAEPHPRLRVKVLYELALAHLRLGETQNCVARHTSKSCILPIQGEGVHVDQSGSREAMKLLREVYASTTDDHPAHLCSRWLLNVAAMTVGEWPEGLEEELRVPPEVFESAVDFPRFPDVAPEKGLNAFDLSGGAVVEDFDGDGLLDVMSSTWHTSGQLRYFRNDGAAGFEERTAEAGLTGLTGGLNLVQADYDGDGDVDVLVLRGAWLSGGRGRYPNSLLRNDGGFFTDVTFRAGLGEPHRPTQAGAWADYDLDGDLDLYVGNESSPREHEPSQLFRNDGPRADVTFVDVAREAGVTNMRFAKGAGWGDYDADGDPDLYVSNLHGWNRLYRNEGPPVDGEGAGAAFVDVAEELGVLGPFDSFALWFWDYDNDGALDLYVTSYFQGTLDAVHGSYRLLPVVASMLGEPHGVELAALYRGDGAGGFANVTEGVGLTGVTLTMGANFGDLDNDGFLDFYLGTGYPHYDGLVPNVMYRNERGRSFADVTAAGGFGHLQKGHGVVFCDLDDDGDLDVFEQMGGAYLGDGFGNVLFENPGTPNNWVKLRLRSESANAHGLGASLRFDFEDRGERRSVYRTVGGTGSFGGNPLEQHVGVGRAERIDRLEIRWPASGARQVLRDLPVNHRILVREGEAEVEVTSIGWTD